MAGDSPAASLDYVVEAAARLTRRRRRFDVVHAHGALSEGAIAIFGRALGMPMLVKILRAGPEGDVQTLLRRPAGRRRLALLVRRAWFVAIAPEVRAELEDVGVPAARIFDIPNGVDLATFRPARDDERRALRDRLGLPPGPLLVYTGRLDPVKRLDVLVRMLAATDGCRLVLVGSGPDRARLETLAAETGVRDRVIVRGCRLERRGSPSRRRRLRHALGRRGAVERAAGGDGLRPSVPRRPRVGRSLAARGRTRVRRRGRTVVGAERRRDHRVARRRGQRRDESVAVCPRALEPRQDGRCAARDAYERLLRGAKG